MAATPVLGTGVERRVGSSPTLSTNTYFICLLVEHGLPLNYHWQDATKEDRRPDMWLAVGRAVNK